MKQYELLLVLPGTMEEKTVSDMAAEVQGVVTKHGAENITMQDRGKSRLAYPIKHIRYGYFHVIQFTAEDGTIIPEIQKELSIMRDVLRAVITTFNPSERADTQKKLGRKEEGPMKTLSSVFERFGGETKTTTDTEETSSSKKSEEKKEQEVSSSKEESTKEAPSEDTASESKEDTSSADEKEKSEEAPIKMEDIDKKLDQLLEDDLKQV